MYSLEQDDLRCSCSADLNVQLFASSIARCKAVVFGCLAAGAIQCDESRNTVLGFRCPPPKVNHFFLEFGRSKTTFSAISFPNHCHSLLKCATHLSHPSSPHRVPKNTSSLLSSTSFACGVILRFHAHFHQPQPLRD